MAKSKKQWMKDLIDNKLANYCEDTNTQCRRICSLEIVHKYESKDDSTLVHFTDRLYLTLFSCINEYSGVTSNYIYIDDFKEGYNEIEYLVSIDKFLTQFYLTNFNGYMVDMNKPDKRSDTFIFSPIHNVEIFVNNKQFSDVMDFITQVQSMK